SYDACMKIAIAPDSFKDALGAKGVECHIFSGLRSVLSDVDIAGYPVSDGGEGFAQALQWCCTSSWEELHGLDPLGREVPAKWLKMLDAQDQPLVAVVELAEVSGLERLESEERDPTKTTTYGTGRLITEALSSRSHGIYLGIGGSATNDAGCGIAQALGVRFFDQCDQLINEPITGRDLEKIKRVDVERSSVSEMSHRMKVACDVTNPLTGPNGAAHIYAPQKGATSEQVEQLDAGLRHMAQLWRDQLGVDVERMPGAGAAGGVGGGLVAMLGAELVPGADLVLDTIGFDERIKDADLVITGEGRLDSQSLNGKAAMAVARRCQKAGVPCVALVGSVGEGAEESLDHGLSAYHVIGAGLPAEESIRRTGELLEQAAMKLAQERLLK
ncbi:MAG: glycerate kinase, partial [Phycisphaeraceae bacterium]